MTPNVTKSDRIKAESDELELGNDFDDSYAQQLANARARVERQRLSNILRANERPAKTLREHPKITQQDVSGGEISKDFSK